MPHRGCLSSTFQHLLSWGGEITSSSIASRSSLSGADICQDKTWRQVQCGFDVSEDGQSSGVLWGWSQRLCGPEQGQPWPISFGNWGLYSCCLYSKTEAYRFNGGVDKVKQGRAGDKLLPFQHNGLLLFESIHCNSDKRDIFLLPFRFLVHVSGHHPQLDLCLFAGKHSDCR